MADRRAGAALALALLAGCSQAPTYHPPAIPMPARFREADAGVWRDAAPAPPDPALAWWTGLGDPELDALETRMLSGNPSLAEAVARHDAALARYGAAHADTLPTLGAGAAITANRQSNDRPLRGANQPDFYGAQTVGAGIAAPVDIWGQLGDRARAARAEAEASADDLAFARTALTAELARRYVALRGLDAEGAILASAVKVYAEAVRVVRARFATGTASGIDLGRVEAQLADAQGQLDEIRGARAVAEHAIAVLVGVQPADLSIPIDVPPLRPLPIVATVPATVLQSRADIVAAERRVYAANRAIGVARAAWFPAITLGAAGGRQSTALAGLAAAPNLFWSLGPQMVLPLFDGGARRARVREARAQWREATELYRGTVLAAMGQVEDNLAQGRQLASELTAADRAAGAEASAARLVYDRYIKGVASILEVVTAQGNELDLRRRAEHTRTRLLQTGISLREAIGDPAGIAPTG